jgi:pantothenate kinase type III
MGRFLNKMKTIQITFHAITSGVVSETVEGMDEIIKQLQKSCLFLCTF